jgi:hypothetical protein
LTVAFSFGCPVPTAAETTNGQTKFDRQALIMQGDGELYRAAWGEEVTNGAAHIDHDPSSSSKGVKSLLLLDAR